VSGADARLSEIDAWEQIKLSKDPANFKEHIEHYPNGLFAELASVRLSKLEAMRSQTPWNWIMTGSIERDTAGPAAMSAFERAVELDNAALTPEDLRVVSALYAEAAAHGLPQAMFALARAFDKGRGTPRNLVEAARWYELAAERNHHGAMAALGTMYEFGDGVRHDMAEALRLYQTAAQAGDPSAQASLAYLFAQGKGVARNGKEARRLYEMAAAKGHVRAMFNLALMDLRGEDGIRDTANGVRLLEGAASRGHAGANLELAYLYDDGRGVTRQPKQAAAHYIEALRAAKREGRILDVPATVWSFSTRRELQRLLAAKGVYRGGIHGFFNAETHKALTAIAQN
jgi:TPR repeat protein